MRHFTMEELTRSETAKRKGIDNTPDEESKKNLAALAAAVLDPLREQWGKAITVSSGYRCPRLNRAVGGTEGSQHLKGEAADICGRDARETAEIGRLAVRLGAFDQVIFEQCDAGCTEAGWVHVSWRRVGENRRQALKLVRGRKGYELARL